MPHYIVEICQKWRDRFRKLFSGLCNLYKIQIVDNKVEREIRNGVRVMYETIRTVY